MATIQKAAPTPPEEQQLHNGDRMTREEFHRLYEAAPEHFHGD